MRRRRVDRVGEGKRDVECRHGLAGDLAGRDPRPALTAFLIEAVTASSVCRAFSSPAASVTDGPSVREPLGSLREADRHDDGKQRPSTDLWPGAGVRGGGFQGRVEIRDRAGTQAGQDPSAEVLTQQQPGRHGLEVLQPVLILLGDELVADFP